VGIGIFPSIEEAARIVLLVERTAPREENLPVYRRMFPAFTRAYEQLAPVFEMIVTE
jgi:hypothetical protein